MQPLPITLFDSYKKQSFSLDPNSTVEKDNIKLYSCGPTIYGYQHIGNMRALWFNDTFSKLAKVLGWKVDWVVNITDVGHLVNEDTDEGEDKMEKGAKRDGKSVAEIVQFYLDDYLLQAKSLNFEVPFGEKMPKASQYIEEQMLLALELVKQKKAYFTDDGIYYDTLANQVLTSNNSNKNDELELVTSFAKTEGEGDSNFTGRDIVQTQKRHPHDAALWKFVSENSLQKWRFNEYPEASKLFVEISQELGIGSDSFNEEIEKGNIPYAFSSLKSKEIFKLIYPIAIDFKWGCPGWHGECVTMISQIIGKKRFNSNSKLFIHKVEEISAENCGVQAQTSQLESSDNPNYSYEIDLHTGGIEHIPIHHKNEILQSEALGFHLSKNWVHWEHLLIDGAKMSKSLGNSYILWDFSKKNYDVLAFKLLLLEHNYQDQMNFTWDKLTQSENRLFNLRKEAAKLKSFWENSQTKADTFPKSPNLSTKNLEWMAVLANNLDTPKFLELYQNTLLEQVNSITKNNSLNENELANLIYFDENFLQLNLFSVKNIDFLKYNKALELGHLRKIARTDKDFAKSDEYRNEIASLGFQVDDYTWGFGIWWKGKTS